MKLIINARGAIEIILFILIVVADAFGFVPITQTIFLLPLIWLSLWLRKAKWASIGFSKPKNLWRAIAIGIVLGLVLEVFAAYVTTPVISGYFGTEPDYSSFSGIQGNLPVLFFFIALSWVLAAFGEEICFRGFLMKRIAGIFGEGNAAWIISLILSSILFGWGHTEQGVSGWIQEGLSGFYLGIMFLAAGRNLAVPIVSHGVSNTLAFVLIYLGVYPGM
ncbi:MAG: CPBP family intramembrane metalloprotease [Gammaproteobacteria bacterium]|nr:CPBP family intramembrane metalloprotease [Gammaproteobacteria bacterium]